MNSIRIRSTRAGFHLPDNEVGAAQALEKVGDLMISCPGDGIEASGLRDHWGVCVGSHGGYHPSLKVAMGECLRCCGIGAYWHVEFGKGESLAALFARIEGEYGL